jgi:hypothetical protein
MFFVHLLDPNSNSNSMQFHVQFRESIDVRANLAVVLEDLPILRTRFADGKATSDVAVNIADLQEGDIDVFAPFDLERGPLCRSLPWTNRSILSKEVFTTTLSLMVDLWYGGAARGDSYR